MVREEHYYAVFENINMSRNKVTVLNFKIFDLVFSMFVHVTKYTQCMVTKYTLLVRKKFKAKSFLVFCFYLLLLFAAV